MGDNRLQPLVLSEAERRTLENWAKRRKTAQGLALRARIVLACAEGRSNTAVAARLWVSRVTVTKWRARFLAKRLDGLGDERRPGVPRTITDAQVEEVVVRTLEEVPGGATHWSKRELARQVGISPTSMHRIWRAFGLQPWRTEDFKISPDPLLIDKVRDVVGLYLAPPANAVVFAVDEKPQIQALERTAPMLPMLPGVPERRSFDYTRHGTIDLFAALNTATGKVIGKPGHPARGQRLVPPPDRARVHPEHLGHLALRGGPQPDQLHRGQPAPGLIPGIPREGGQPVHRDQPAVLPGRHAHPGANRAQKT
jgi:transposase